MNALAAYAINEHLAQLTIEAQQARLAREARGNGGPSPTRRDWNAIRSVAARLRASTDTAPTLA